MLNIVIPMAGAGSRFVAAGYQDPKPLIAVNGIAMIQLVINNLRPQQPHRFIFICQQAHIDAYDLQKKLTDWSPGCHIIGLNGITQGAACTVLAAKNLINNDDQLMIANSDQYIDIDVNEYLAAINGDKVDGLIMTMQANDPKWSYAGIDENKKVTHVVEKKVISNEATVGIYNFKKGREFVEAAEMMIANNLHVNNEFYVAPAYNQLIANGKNIHIFNIGKEADGMYGLGIPADLELFLALPVHKKATKLI
ncbi:MAG: glycosyltransferase family 2 protein [Pseudomonadota bacterium]